MEDGAGRVARNTSRLLAAQIPKQAEQVEHQRECVLAFGDPGDRAGANGMDGEEDRAEPGAGNSQTPQDAPEQQGAGGVQ